MFQHTTGAEVGRSFATIKEMLHDRGLDTSSLDDVSNEEVAEQSGKQNVFNVDVQSCGLRIIYNMNPKFKMSDVRKNIDNAPPDMSQFIVVVVEKPVQGKGIDELARDIQMFQIRELQFNVSRHMHVPRHEPIRDEAQIDAVVKRYRLKSRFQLPLILSNDPMARYLALKPGQLVRVTRPSPSAGTYVLFRCCTRA